MSHTAPTLERMLANTADEARRLYEELQKAIARQISSTADLAAMIAAGPVTASCTNGTNISTQAQRIETLQAQLQSLIRIYERSSGKAFSLPSEA